MTLDECAAELTILVGKTLSLPNVFFSKLVGSLAFWLTIAAPTAV